MDDFTVDTDIILTVFDSLPDIEKSVIECLYFKNIKQEETGALLNISQEMVCYFKQRALVRIKVLAFLKDIDVNDMEQFLKNHVTWKQKNAMMEYFKMHDLRKIVKNVMEIERGRHCRSRRHLHGKHKKVLPYEAIASRIKLGLKTLSLIGGKYYTVFCLLKKFNSLHHTQSKLKCLNL